MYFLCFITIRSFSQDDSSLCCCWFCCCQLLVALPPDSFRHRCRGHSPVPACTSKPQRVPFPKPSSSSPFSTCLSSFAPTPPCSAVLPPEQIGWGDSCRRSTFLYPGHTYCSPDPRSITCLAPFLPLVRRCELLLQEWPHFM